ncbi:hypothetical protein Pla86_41500 [Planctomycetes bacterium Pla86]|uniref:Uncharacterized protein n=1 Tax=Engelhardtia mirabilis TaxID=2528011 RepID=A0A518BPY5_9BACT|nr:hypothetical protein Pla133_41510 [Planctomycetes bacterium Pla133]QDV03362.1 hypothetical protein Pla86_41500 [Planctomycetes bacterium Pla86]
MVWKSLTQFGVRGSDGTVPQLASVMVDAPAAGGQLAVSRLTVTDGPVVATRSAGGASTCVIDSTSVSQGFTAQDRVAAVRLSGSTIREDRPPRRLSSAVEAVKRSLVIQEAGRAGPSGAWREIARRRCGPWHELETLYQPHHGSKHGLPACRRHLAHPSAADLCPTAASPAIDGDLPACMPLPGELDLDGATRVQGDTADLGRDETSPCGPRATRTRAERGAASTDSPVRLGSRCRAMTGVAQRPAARGSVPRRARSRALLLRRGTASTGDGKLPPRFLRVRPNRVGGRTPPGGRMAPPAGRARNRVGREP